MITEDYVSFETAKLLKEKGFDEITFTWYTGKGKFCVGKNNFDDYHMNRFSDMPCAWDKNKCSAPTLQMAMKWLREVHNLFIFITTWLRNKDGTVQYYYGIRNLNDKDFETIAESTITEFDSPEKTCETAMKYCLENLI